MLFSNQATTLIEIEGIVSQIISNEKARAKGLRTHVGDGLEQVCIKLMKDMGTYLSAYDPVSCLRVSSNLHRKWLSDGFA